MRFFLSLMLLLIVCLGLAIPCLGEDNASNMPAAALVPRLDLTAGVFGLYNPTAGAAWVEMIRSYPLSYAPEYEAVWSKWGFGVQGVFCPAYTDLGALLEWMPTLFAVFRLRYDVYFHHGYFGEVLSYNAIPSDFMESDLTARSGEEETAFGQRVLFQPTLRGQLGKVAVQNQTDAAWYDTYAEGPYIFNWDYETFTALRDFIIENRTDVLLEMQRGAGETRFLIGPQYGLTYTVHTRLRRQRVGISLYWVPRDRPKKPGYIYVCLASGVNLEAVLEEKSPYLVFVLGGAWGRTDKGK